MLKLSSVTVFVSLSFIWIFNENKAVETNQPQNSENAAFEIGQSQNSATTFETEIEEEPDELDPTPSSHPNIEPNIKPFEVLTTEEFAQKQSPDTIYRLPSEWTEENGNWALASGLRYRFVIPLCPELKTSDTETMRIWEGIRKTFPNVAKCLFVRNFEKAEARSCDQKPQFVVEKIKEKDGSSVICGINDDQQLVEVQYLNCGSETDLQNYEAEIIQRASEGRTEVPVFEPRRYTMYQICYDFQKHKTVWTKHEPMTPALIMNQKSPYKESSDEIRIEDFDDDASSFNLTDSTFQDLKSAYEDTDVNETTVFTMVPEDHMALLYWKKATNHMINSAPLRPAFIILMKAIHNGILQASIKLGRTLQIYTKADSIISPVMRWVANLHSWFPGMSYLTSGTSLNLFEPNIWCMLVYDEIDKSGIFIALHNTNEESFELLCANDEFLFCNFNSWFDSPELIFEDVLRNAYCCTISGAEAEKFFSIKKIELDKTLNIHNIISGEPIEPLLSSGIDDQANKKYL